MSEMWTKLRFGAFLVCLALLAVSWECSAGRDRVLLREVTAITLRQGQMTAGRRSSPVPQLTCIGGFAGCHVSQPKIVQCYNRGWSGQDVQWECQGQMDKRFKFGRITVTCEGYDYPDDPYILHGSCGLEYELDYTDLDGHRDDEYYHHEPYQQRFGHQNYQSETRQRGSVIGSVIGFIIVAFLIFACCKTCQAARMGGSSGSYTHTGTAGSAPPPTQGGGPGFWTGAGVGGALGYLFGRNNNRRHYHNPNHGWNVPGGSSGWFGGGSSHHHHRSSYGGSRSSSSGSTHTSTSYGGTKRR